MMDTEGLEKPECGNGIWAIRSLYGWWNINNFSFFNRISCIIALLHLPLLLQENFLRWQAKAIGCFCWSTSGPWRLYQESSKVRHFNPALSSCYRIDAGSPGLLHGHRRHYYPSGLRLCESIPDFILFFFRVWDPLPDTDQTILSFFWRTRFSYRHYECQHSRIFFSTRIPPPNKLKSFLIQFTSYFIDVAFSKRVTL